MPLMPRIFRTLAALALLLVWPSLAQAACTANSGAVDLGTPSSFSVAASAQGASGSTGFSCTGSLLSLASTNTVTATIASATNSSGTQGRLYNSTTGDYIPYTICKDSSCSPTYAIGSQVVWSSTTFLGLLGLFNATGGTLPIYIRTTPGTQVAAGNYTSTITVNWSWHLCSVGLFGACVYEDGSTSSTITVTLTVTQDCTITAPTLSFGTAALVSSLDPVSQTITIRCTKGSSYSVGIDNGAHYASGNRRMTNGTNGIAYDIYFPVGSANRWGTITAERRSSAQATTGAGTYTGSTDQTFTYRAQIISGQSTPPAGTYIDTLMVDITF